MPNVPQGGRMDQSTRRSGNDAIQGNFCAIDVTDAGVIAAYATAGITGGPHNVGTYIEPATLDGNGYPVTAVVRLHDSTNARVVLPYAALKPAGPDAGGPTGR